RGRDAGVPLGALAPLLDERPAVPAAVDETVALVNADPDTLDSLLERQNYRLAFWRTAGRDLPYRRFFDINTLVGLNMEREEVFADTHLLVLRWLARGVLDGVRIDHPARRPGTCSAGPRRPPTSPRCPIRPASAASRPAAPATSPATSCTRRCASSWPACPSTAPTSMPTREGSTPRTGPSWGGRRRQ